LTDANVVSQAIEIVQNSNVDAQTVSQTFSFITSTFNAFMQLAALNTLIIFTIAGITWLVNHFLISTTIGKTLPSFVNYFISFLIVMFTFGFWAPTVLPIVFKWVG